MSKRHRFLPDLHPEEIAARQLAGLKWTVAHAAKGSPFYRKRLKEAGVDPAGIASLDDLRRLPFTTAHDLQDGYPLPLLSVPEKDVVRIHASSGTTGKRKVLSYTQADIDTWKNMFARCYELAGLTTLDRVQVCVGYGLWTAGAGFQLGSEHFGALTVPVGPGMMEIQLQMLVDLQTTCLCSTASMALLLGEEIHKRGIADKIAVKKIIYGSERSSRSMRKKISELFGGAELFDITGLTELYGPGAGIECSDHDCIHYWADYYLLEILDPETLQPMPDGEWGEMVITTLCKEGSPLIRYRTRDITRIIPGPCTCGSLMPRHSRIKGRSDDTIKFRGVNIYPSSIDTILSAVPGLGSEYQIHLTRGEGGRDNLRLVVERAEGVGASRAPEMAHEAVHQIKRQLMVSVDLDIVDYGSLPRSERKSQRVFDSRIQDEIV